MKKFIDIKIFNIFKKYFLYIRIQTDLVDGAVPHRDNKAEECDRDVRGLL